MDAMPQVPLGQSNLFLNPEQRCPCVLLLDRSYSMHGAKIAELNAGLQAFLNDVSADPIALRRVEIAVITYGPTQVAQPFTTADRVQMPALTADSDTPMGAAIMMRLKLLEDRKADVRSCKMRKSLKLLASSSVVGPKPTSSVLDGIHERQVGPEP